MATNAALRDKTVISATFPRELAARLAEAARAHDRSVSGEIRRAVTAHLERIESPARPQT